MLAPIYPIFYLMLNVVSAKMVKTKKNKKRTYLILI